MSPTRIAVVLGGLVFAAAGWAVAGDPRPTSRRDSLRDFALKDLAGKTWTLADLRDARAVVLAWTAPGCPVAMVQAPRIAEMASRWGARGVRFLGVDSNADEDPARLAAHAREHGWTFPVLLDGQGTLAERVDARTTTTVVLLDENRRVRYRGALDDQYGVGGRKAEPGRRFVEEALRAVLDHRAVEVERTDAPGCPITFAKRTEGTTKVTWSDGAAAIVHRRCAGCHAPNQGGPFPLLTWDDVRSRTAVLEQVVSEGRMPPWHADAAPGVFANDRRLSTQEKDVLLAWLKAGAPAGDLAKAPAPPQPRNADGWEIGTPDAVIEFAEAQEVPAEGVVPYRFVEVPTSFPEDRWVQAVEVVPGAPDVVHHVLVAIGDVGPRRGRRGLFLPTRGFFAAMVPGGRAQVWPEGMAKRLPKGALLVFQMHYTPNGVATTDRTKIGFRFAKEPPKQEVFTSGAFNAEIRIPAGEADHEEVAWLPVIYPVKVLAFMPHMHVRGKSVRFEIVRGSEDPNTVLDVPHYDFNWQTPYRYAEPFRVELGSRLKVTAVFDNSAQNPYNPDPTAEVRWGDQTWEEMLIGYVDYVRE